MNIKFPIVPKSVSRGIPDKELKILLGTSGSCCAICRRDLVEPKTSTDPSVFVGEIAHIVSGAAKGPRSDPLFPRNLLNSYDNLILLCPIHHKVIDEQVTTYTVSELHEIKRNHEKAVRLALDNIKDSLSLQVGVAGRITNIRGTREETIGDKLPMIDLISGPSHSGGPDGHFEEFVIKNIGEGTSIDIVFRIRGFGYEWTSPVNTSSLMPSETTIIKYPISSEITFMEAIPELSAVMEFNDSKGNTYFTRRDLRQIEVPSGAFFNLAQGTFHPPVKVIEDKVDFLEILEPTGDRVEALFKVSDDKVKIGISGSLIAIWKLENAAQIKQALLELGYRKIRRMNSESKLSDYIFTSHELNEKDQGGFESYQKFRDSI